MMTSAWDCLIQDTLHYSTIRVHECLRPWYGNSRFVSAAVHEVIRDDLNPVDLAGVGWLAGLAAYIDRGDGARDRVPGSYLLVQRTILAGLESGQQIYNC